MGSLLAFLDGRQVGLHGSSDFGDPTIEVDIVELSFVPGGNAISPGTHDLIIQVSEALFRFPGPRMCISDRTSRVNVVDANTGEVLGTRFLDVQAHETPDKAVEAFHWQITVGATGAIVR